MLAFSFTFDRGLYCISEVWLIESMPFYGVYKVKYTGAKALMWSATCSLPPLDLCLLLPVSELDKRRWSCFLVKFGNKEHSRGRETVMNSWFPFIDSALVTHSTWGVNCPVLEMKRMCPNVSKCCFVWIHMHDRTIEYTEDDNKDHV